jgi:hypothetical protein
MFDITQFRQEILSPALDALQIRSLHLKELLVFTCAVESAGGTYVRQDKGSGLGIFQMQPSSFTDLWATYIIRKPDILNLISLNLGVYRMPQPTEMICNLSLAVAMCALFYKSKNAIPEDSEPETLFEIYNHFYKMKDKDFCMKAYKKFTKI